MIFFFGAIIFFKTINEPLIVIVEVYGRNR